MVLSRIVASKCQELVRAVRAVKLYHELLHNNQDRAD